MTLTATIALTPHHPVRGAALLLAAMACFAASDALVKLFAQDLSAYELAWLRYAALLATVLAGWRFAAGRLGSVHPWWQTLRAAGLIGSALFFLQGLRGLPIAEATAIVFVSPLFVTLAAVGILREKVARRRWWPIAIGSAGVLMVVQPGGARFSAAALFPVLSSLSWTLAIVCTRRIGSADPVATTMLYSSAAGLGFLTLMLPDGSGIRLMQSSPWCLVMALCWCGGQWLAVAAYRSARASAIAPFSYSQLLWAALLGYIVWHHVPDRLAAAGMALILAGGLYAAWQGKQEQRQPLSQTANR
ncbi:MAG: DMT family transporter [Herbaspirillum sp.]|nr:DMT family transporter [Herbaspirillum sp.]